MVTKKELEERVKKVKLEQLDAMNKYQKKEITFGELLREITINIPDKILRK